MFHVEQFNKKLMKTLLVDGNSLLKNSFEATLSTEEYKKNFNGTFLFLLKLRIILDSDRYTHLKVVFDGNRSGELRRAIYPEYKLKRLQKKLYSVEDEKSLKYQQQKADLKFYLEFFCNVYEDDIVEADDIIAYYVENKAKDEKITIVTGDFDILQRISKDVNVYYLNKTFKVKSRTVERYEKNEDRKNLLIDHKNFKKIFGFPYENIKIIKTICGDDSDEIKNVKGVRETTLFGMIPAILEKVLTISEIKSICLNLLNPSNVLIESTPKIHLNACKNILEGVTDGSQGKQILEINERIVDLNNFEFLTEQCIKNLTETGFLSKETFKSSNSVSMVKRMTESGILEHINKKSKDLKYFFKPFLKTFTNN